MNKILLLLVLLLISQYRADLSTDLQAHFPLGDDNDISGNSRTLLHSNTRLSPVQNQENQTNKAYEAISQNEQFLETDLSYITADFTISVWMKFQEGIPHRADKYPTIISILFESGEEADLELINFTTQYVFANKNKHQQLNNYMIKSQEWELVSLIRNSNEFYIYTKSKGYIQLNFAGGQGIFQNPGNTPNKLRLGSTFDNQYKQNDTNYYIDSIFSDLRIHSRALDVSELHKIAYTNYVDYQLDQIQIAHYPLNKNLNEINSAQSRLNFYVDGGIEQIKGRSAFDRKKHYTSAISLDNGADLYIPIDIVQGLQQFTISFYVFGLGVENTLNVENQLILLDFYDEDNDITYFSFASNYYTVDDQIKYYSFFKKVLDGAWNHVVLSVDGSSQQLDFCVNQQCIVESLSTPDFVSKTSTISLAYLPEVAANANPGFLKLDDLRIFNTILTDYQIVDVSALSSAYDETKLLDETYLYRFDNNLYSDLEIDLYLYGFRQYPIMYSNVEYTTVNFNDKVVTAAHGPEINLPMIYQPRGQASFTLSIYVKAKNINQVQSSSKIIRFEVNSQYIDIFYGKYIIFGQEYNIANYNETADQNQGWFNIVVKARPDLQMLVINGQQFPGISLIESSPLSKITAYGDEFFFTNFIYNGYAIDKKHDENSLNYVLANPRFNDKLDEDTSVETADHVDPPSTDEYCYGLLATIHPSQFEIQFELNFMHGEYYHNYDILYHDFLNKPECFDTKILIGSQETTFTHKNFKSSIQFPHLQAEDKGCDKPTDTNTQCKFEIEISFNGQPQAIRYFTSVVNTPDLQDVSKDLTYAVQVDTYQEGQDYVIDQSLDTKLSLCTDATCSEYKNSIDLPKGEDAYLEFKIETPGYDQYYPSHVSFQKNNIDVPLENQSEIDTWQEQGRIIYKFIPHLSGQNIKLSVRVNLSKDNPHTLRILEELEKERKNIGDHLYIRVVDADKQNLNNSQKLYQKGRQNNERDDDNMVLLLAIGVVVVLSIASVSMAVVFYKLKMNGQKLEQQKQKVYPFQDGKDQSVIDQQSLSIQTSNNISDTRQQITVIE